jgi:hypothetical protein
MGAGRARHRKHCECRERGKDRAPDGGESHGAEGTRVRVPRINGRRRDRSGAALRAPRARSRAFEPARSRARPRLARDRHDGEEQHNGRHRDRSGAAAESDVVSATLGR